MNKNTNPFYRISIDHRDHATALARAFVSSHGQRDVYACIRFARRNGLLPEGDYLAGCHFTPYVDSYGDIAEFHGLVNLADNYLERLAELSL